MRVVFWRIETGPRDRGAQLPGFDVESESVVVLS